MSLPEKEKLPIKERPVLPEIPPEIEHVEVTPKQEFSLPTPVIDDSGQTILDNTAPQQVTIILPLTEEEMIQALRLKIIYAARWLAEWTKRLIKIIGGKFAYKLKNNN